MSAESMVLRFDEGTLVLEGAAGPDGVPPQFGWDERVSRWRAPALAYRDVVQELADRAALFDDRARGYEQFDFSRALDIEPRPYQTDAIRKWRRAGSRDASSFTTRRCAAVGSTWPRSSRAS